MTDARMRASRYLIVGGAILIGIAFIWWLWFFSWLTNSPANAIADAWGCLFASGGQCDAARRVGRFSNFIGRGAPPAYQPILLYLGLAALALGLFVKRAPRTTGSETQR